MAGVLTVVAEEVGRAVGLVWGGVGVAIKLNNQVMSVILKVTSRIVHLLLLLTQKAADLLSIIVTDLLLFLADVGNAVLAVGSAFRSAAYLVVALVFGMYQAVVSVASYSCQLVHACYVGVVSGTVEALGQVGNALNIIKHAFVLFGSSVVFLVSLIPNLVCLVFSGLLYLTSYLYLSCHQALCGVWLNLVFLMHLCVDAMAKFLSDIPLEAVLGVGLGVAIMVGFKYTVSYMMDNMILVPDMPIPTLLSVARQRTIQWYLEIVRRAQRRPPVEIETEEEEVDDADDENDDNQQAEIPGPLPALPQPNQLHDIQPQIPEEQVQPIIPLLQARRPITRQLIQRQEEEVEEVIPATSGKVKPNPETNTRLDNQAYHLYRELEQEREDRLCVVCQDRPKRVILLPCRHLCLCDACRSAIITRDNSCPVCRRPILQTLRVFL
ncbi:hypothetical protein Pmani_033753 [Petrolisthes manimaculis]|uniref:RING-type domain-containing protein n=1 Tax=Petrolisthes manimaculis TaxID=1843537 RepID=A0AAE1NNV9_9EUCA|nr:hypothetical protein Pmani_033753 [Petrolisthes manimaculis]